MLNATRQTEDEAFVSKMLARASLYWFTRSMFYHRKAYAWQKAPHHQLICDKLEKVFSGEITRLIINIPPRYSKTEIAAINFIAWALGHCPDAEFILTSYSGELATNNSYLTRELVRTPGYQEIFPDVKIKTDRNATDHWGTTKGGLVHAVGSGGTIIIDDPHKPDEARSVTNRQRVIQWYQNTLASRLNDPTRTPIILIMQRLHEEDLAGWLMSGGSGEQWDTLILPALQDDGTALWPEKHDADKLRAMQQASAYTFAGQYQQRPAPAGGGMFKKTSFATATAAPAGMRLVRAWDLASSEAKQGASPDWTAGVLMGLDPLGYYWILDVVHIRNTPLEVERAIVNTARQDVLRGSSGYTVSIPQDPGAGGKAWAQALVRALAGFDVVLVSPSGAKDIRARPFAAQAEAGNVRMVAGPWNTEYLDELALFPNGKHDDQVDASSDAFNLLATPAKQALFG